MTENLLEFACSFARSAGEILRRGYGQAGRVERKAAAIDLVTEYDRRAEAHILAAIRAAYPQHAILAEESGDHGGSEFRWLVDPLDGTTNFAHAIPIFAVSIAVQRAGRLLAGVVYDPMRDEMFAAGAGHGATLNGQPVRVSGAAELGSSLLVTGFPYDMWTNPENNLAQFGAFAVRTRGVRRLGSAALDLAYVAAGRFDGFWELRLQPWDVAAGALLVMEAGGLVTDARGGADFLNDPSILAANPALHARMLEVLRTT